MHRSRLFGRCGRIMLAAGVAAGLATGVGTVPAVAAPQLAGSSVPRVHRTALTPAQIARYSKNPNRRVIVLLRNQLPYSSGAGVRAGRARSRAIAHAQQAIRSELVRLHTPNVTSYQFVNALAAQVSALEARRLASDPQVLAVVPDRKITLRSQVERAPRAAASAAPSPTVNTTPGLCGTSKAPLTEPEALGQMHAAATHYGITGKGVRIAVFPDGLDPSITDFVRPNGTRAIFDYKDFTGDGPNGVTDGGEAFGDASSIIAQGRVTYDLSGVVNSSLPLPNPCDIRVKGVAPDASVAVMKVFGLGSSFNSLILDAMDYAVSHDHVNVLSESFGGNPVPDPATDPVAVFNAVAVAHGITVVASSGDAGVNNTIGTPASGQSGIISAGATTSFRSHAQLSEHGYRLGNYRGWESNNIATLSSGGFTDYGPNTVDLVAPGDTGWASCSRNSTIFLSCANPYGGTDATPGTFLFGGTSEACPLIAASAALVIQAYRSTHRGTSPSPAVVKQILTGTADDLNMPVVEQGAGQVDALRAIQLARSYQSRSPVGATASFAPTKIATVGQPGSAHTATVSVRDTSRTARTVTPVLQQFTAPKTVGSATFAYAPNSPSTPTFTYWLTGQPEPYVEQDFTVPAGFQRLNVRFGYAADQTDSAQSVFEVLFDPRGRLAQDSDPQGGPLGFGQGDVRNPMAGTWRAIFFSRPASDKYSGPITFQATVQKRVSSRLGSISPSHARVAPNGVGTFTVTYPTPVAPGDASFGINFGAGIGVLPVLTRSVAQPAVGSPATFSGELTTGNGRMALPSQELPFQFYVPSGVKDFEIAVRIADPGYSVIGLLTAPNRSPVDVAATTFLDYTRATPTQTSTQNLQLSWRNPQPGRWEIDLASIGGSGSGKVATTVSATIAFDTVSVTSAGVPRSSTTTLTAGSATTATVKVTNTGTSPKVYFIDPRREGQSTYSLGFLNNPNGRLPVNATLTPQAVVPPTTSSLTMIAHSTKPAAFSMSPAFGTPEIESTRGTTSVASLSASNIPASQWGCAEALLGPFPKPTTGATFSCAAFATTDTIDDTVSATGGNVWDTFTDPNTTNVFNPTHATVVQPGHSTTLRVTITPSPDDVGNAVHGYLAVQSFDAFTDSGDELAHIPYQYSVAAPPTT